MPLSYATRLGHLVSDAVSGSGTISPQPALIRFGFTVGPRSVQPFGGLSGGNQFVVKTLSSNSSIRIGNFIFGSHFLQTALNTLQLPSKQSL